MDFQWQVDDEAPTPTPAPSATPNPRRRRKAILIVVVVAAGAVALALWWPKYRANQVLRDVEAEVRTTLERELRAARDNDDEVFRAITGIRLDRAARDPATGLTPPLPGVQSLPGVDIRVRAIPPDARGGRVQSAEADLTYQITDGLGTGPYSEHRTLTIDEKGAWHSEPAATARLASANAVRFRQTEWLASYLEIGDPVGPGTVRLLHEPGDGAEARAWYDMLAREVNAYCAARDAPTTLGALSSRTRAGPGGPAGDQPCELRVALAGAAGTVFNVTRLNQTYLVLPSPSAYGALEPNTADVLRRTATRYALASLAGVPPFTEPWMDLIHSWPAAQLSPRASDPIPSANSGAYGGRAALRAAVLEQWLVHRGLALDEPDASPHTGQEPSLVSMLADHPPPVPKGADLALAASTRLAAARIVSATGREAIPALLASYSEDPVEWLATVLPVDHAEHIAAWPRGLARFPANRIALAECGGLFGRDCWACGTDDVVAFLPGRELPIDLGDLACGPNGREGAAYWSPGGAHLAVACSKGDERDVVVIEEATVLHEQRVHLLDIRPVPKRTDIAAATMKVESVCCLSWSGDGKRLSWLECCPGKARFAAVADAVSALPAPDWTADWAASVWAAREYFDGGPDAWSGGAATDQESMEALRSGYPMRTARTFLWANSGIAWAPTGTLAAMWDGRGAGGYLVGDVEGAPLWRSSGHRPLWRPDGELVAEIEALSAASITVTVRAAATGALVARTELTPRMTNEAGGDRDVEADFIEPNDISFSPDGAWLVTSGRWWQDGRAPELGGTFVAAWDPASGAVRMRAAAGVEIAVGWWPDGTLRLRRTDDYEGILESAWNPATDQLNDVVRLPGGAGAIPSPGGTTFLMSDPGNGGALVLTKPTLDGPAAEDVAVWWTYGARACRPVSWQPEGGW